MPSPLDTQLDLGRERLEFSLEFMLRPNAWAAHNDAFGLRWSRRRRWDPTNVRGIPNVPGVYAFSVVPSVEGCPPGEYVLYVGMAERQTLVARYRNYVREARGEKGTRVHVYNMFKRWSDHLWYRYAIVAAQNVSATEQALRVALEPPINRDFSADLNAAGRAFNRI